MSTNFNKKILLVDDNEKTIKLLAHHLAPHEEFITSVASNGQEALERALHSKPDLILMDINMPVMDGVEACKKIRENEDIKDTPIIFLTAENSLEDRVQALNAKGNDFVSKPFYKEELILRIKLHLEFMESKQKIKTSLEKTNEMLDNIGQSIFWIDKNGIVLSPSSKTTDKVMGFNIEGQSVLNTLYKGLEEKQKNEVTSLFEKIPEIKRGEFEKLQQILPKEIKYFNDTEKKEKKLEADYKFFWDNNDSILKIMILLEDKTDINYLISQKSVYSMKMASSLSGVQVGTIRSWETRHKAVVPFRDPKGKRFYNERELEKIKLLKLSTDLGMTISSVAKLENEQIKEIIEKTKKGRFSSTNTSLSDTNLEETAQNVNLAITNADHTKLNEELKSLANYPEKVHLIDKFFPTVMKVMQEKAENETLNKEEFESITAFFKFYLTPSIFNNSESSQKVIITFFDNPYWELEVFQTALVCLENNLNVIFYNASENGKEIADRLNLFQADWLILFCGSHIKSGPTESTEIIHTIINKIEEDKKLIITGNFNYSENHFLKHKNLFPLPTVKDLNTGLKKMNIRDIE